MEKPDFLKPVLLPIIIILLFTSVPYDTNCILSSDHLVRNNQREASVLPIRVNTKTSSFDVINVDREGDRIAVTFQNNYDKAITAFSLAINNSRTNFEFIDTDKIIPPGHTTVKEYRLPNQPQRSEGRTSEDTITVLAVVFDNKSGDGERKIIQEILDTRTGDKIQLKRILPILCELLDQPDANLSAGLSMAKSRINNLPRPEAIQMSPSTDAAIQDTMQVILYQLEELERVQPERGISELRKQLSGLIARYQKKLSRRE